MALVHDFRDVAGGIACCSFDELITIAAPPSIVLRALERYFDGHGNVLDAARGAKVTVEHEAHPNIAIIARFDDRLVVRFSLAAERRYLFHGRFTIRPLSGDTELQLKGHLEIPHARDAIHTLLRDLKAAIEADFASLQGT